MGLSILSAITDRTLLELARILLSKERLKYDVELLRDIKCDRDEFIDTLRDKAGIQDLNGMVSQDQFHAAFINVGKEINDVYSTFRKQEETWQKAIDDIFENIQKKVDTYHVDGLRDDIQMHLNKLKDQVDCIKQIIGEPLAASVTKRIYRDTACLSCANPAHIMPETSVPILPPLRPSAIGADNQTQLPKEDGDYHKHTFPACVAGLKITHPIDPRAEMCTRYCGGGHTKKRTALSLKTHDLKLEAKPLSKSVLGIDGKVYQIEEQLVQQPCIPCNQGDGTLQGLGDAGGPNDIGHNRLNHFSAKHDVNKCEYGETSAGRCSFTPSLPPMQELSGMPSVSRPSFYSDQSMQMMRRFSSD